MIKKLLFIAVIVIAALLTPVCTWGQPANSISVISTLSSSVNTPQEFIKQVASCLIERKSNITLKIDKFDLNNYDIPKLVREASDSIPYDGWYLGEWSYTVDTEAGLVQLKDIFYYKSPVNCFK